MRVLNRIAASNDTINPVYPSSGSVGVRLFCQNDVSIEPRSFKAINTGYHSVLEEGDCGIVVPHSKLFESGLIWHTGIIDVDYDKEIYFYLRNITDESIVVRRGDILCQFIIVGVQRFENIKENDGVRVGKFGRIEE